MSIFLERKLRLRKRSAQRSCGYCREALGAEPIICRSCNTAVHAECALELEACLTIGCLNLFKRPRNLAPPLSLVGDEWRFLPTGVPGIRIANNALESRLSFSDEGFDPHEIKRVKFLSKNFSVCAILTFFSALLWLFISMSPVSSLVFCGAVFVLFSIMAVSDQVQNPPWKSQRTVSITASPESWTVDESYPWNAWAKKDFSTTFSFQRGEAETHLRFAAEDAFFEMGDRSILLPKADRKSRRILILELRRAWQSRSQTHEESRSQSHKDEQAQ